MAAMDILTGGGATSSTTASGGGASKSFRSPGAAPKQAINARDLRIAEAWWFNHMYTNQLGWKEGDHMEEYFHATPLINVVLSSSKGDRELAMLIDTIQVACKSISAKVTDSGSCTRGEITGANLIAESGGNYKQALRSAKSAHGRAQRELDIVANKIMARALFNSRCCCVLVSSENTEPLVIPPRISG
jgi:hypothetical protein